MPLSQIFYHYEASYISSCRTDSHCTNQLLFSYQALACTNNPYLPLEGGLWTLSLVLPSRHTTAEASHWSTCSPNSFITLQRHRLLHVSSYFIAGIVLVQSVKLGCHMVLKICVHGCGGESSAVYNPYQPSFFHCRQVDTSSIHQCFIISQSDTRLRSWKAYASTRLCVVLSKHLTPLSPPSNWWSFSTSRNALQWTGFFTGDRDHLS